MPWPVRDEDGTLQAAANAVARWVESGGIQPDEAAGRGFFTKENAMIANEQTLKRLIAAGNKLADIHVKTTSNYLRHRAGLKELHRQPTLFDIQQAIAEWEIAAMWATREIDKAPHYLEFLTTLTDPDINLLDLAEGKNKARGEP